MRLGGGKSTPNARVFAVVLMALAVVLAGCTGFGGLSGESDDNTAAGSGNAEGAGPSTENTGADDSGASDAIDGADNSNDANAGSDDTDGDGADKGSGADNGDASGSDSGNSDEVIVPLADDPENTEQWFNLSTPGRYEFEIESAEEGIGTMSFEISPVSDGRVTIDTHYEMGGESSDSSVTAPVEEVQGQLATSPGFQYLILLSLSGIGPAAQLGGQDLKVGNNIQRSTNEGSYSIEVTEKRNYGGVECYFIETWTNGTLTNEVCTQGTFQGAPYVAVYNESGLQQRIELTEYEKG